MPINWPTVANTGGGMPQDQQTKAKQALDRFGDLVAHDLESRGLSRVASPLFQAWDSVFVLDAEKLIAVFAEPRGGVLEQRWAEVKDQRIDSGQVAAGLQQAFGKPIQAVISLPRSVVEGADDQQLRLEVQKHVDEVDSAFRLRGLGDLTPFPHRIGPLQEFIKDHPHPERNVFIMMSFAEDARLDAIHEVIRKVLSDRGFDGIRADDRDYTGDMWGNVETCLLGSTLGIAVFESLVHPESPAFNANVALELGYVLGRGRRCLILKEDSLKERPNDIIHKLYRPFYAEKLEESITREVVLWIERDLGFAGSDQAASSPS